MSDFRREGKKKQTIVDDAQLADSGQRRKNALEVYLVKNRPSHQITAQELDEYRQAQRDRMDVSNATFGLLKHSQKIEPLHFILAKIEYVVSMRDFYAVQVCHMEARIEFQNILNRTYEDDCEPIDNIKVKDICVVLYDLNWCRAEVVEAVTECIGKVRYIVYLMDYGRSIYTKKKHLYILKEPHNQITPFAIKCQLSITNEDEEEPDDETKYSLSKIFEKMSQDSTQFLLYMNGLNVENRDIYNVMLFTDIKTDLDTVYHAYLLHEAYGAFVRPNVRFENEVCEQWSGKLVQMTKECSSDCSKKMLVYISHVVSPAEIYVRCTKAQAFMTKIRRIIDAYVKKSSDKAGSNGGEWPIGMDCLVRLQNWKTETNLKQWYRGRIIKQNFFKTFTVFLRDYGRNAEVNCNDLMPISPQLAAPANAVQKCCLKISEIWTESSADLLRTIIEEYEHFAISNISKIGSNLVVALWGSNYAPHQDNNIGTFELWDSIGLKIVSQSIIDSMEPFIKNTQRLYDKIQSRKNSNQCVDTDVSEYSSEYQRLELSLKELELLAVGKFEETIKNDRDGAADLLPVVTKVSEWLPPIPIDRNAFNGIVTHITEYGTIYLQEEYYNEAAYELGQTITNHIKKLNHAEVKDHIWQVGEPCFAEFDMSCYHRAVIKKINHEEGTCEIKYVDYGDKAVMKLDDLYPATDFGDIPILVQKLYVHNLVPADKSGKWCKVVMREFRSKLLNELCIVSIENTTRDEDKTDQILPCSIEPHALPCDMYKWLLKKNLGYKTGLNENGEDVLFV